MKPHFKASSGAINMLSSLWFDMWTVWFATSLSCINMTLKLQNILFMSCSFVQYQAFNHFALRPVALKLSDCKPDA